MRVMFEDEARFGRISDTRRCWVPKGIRPNVPTQLVREYTYAFAAVSPHDGIVDSLILPEVNSSTMSIFLDEISKRHSKEHVLMFMDQAPWHKSGELKIPDNIKLKWLPPYSPQCNPTEHLWDDIREKYFANKVFSSMNGVEDTLMRALFNMESDHQKTKSLTGFDWVVNISLIAN